MTIDEAIAHERAKADKARESEALFLHDDLIWNAKESHKRLEEHEQLAEWLELLKELLKINVPKERTIAFHDGYSKAIDDFVKFANTMPTVETEDGEIRPMWLEEMAEQLKAGGKNESK